MRLRRGVVEEERPAFTRPRRQGVDDDTKGFKASQLMNDGEAIAELLSALVAIPSVNPAFDPQRTREPGEAAIAAHLAAAFGRLGAHVQTEDVEPGRPNVYVVIPGDAGEWDAIDVHTDTVGVTDMPDPFGGQIADGVVRGRGAVDTKPTLAILLWLAEELARRGHRPRAGKVLLFTVGEEDGGVGARRARAWLDRNRFGIERMVVAEPTGCHPAHGHKGTLRCKLTVRGLAAHTAKPELGLNAVSSMGRVLVALDAESERLRGSAPGPLGVPLLTATLIEGGVGLNVVPPACTLTVDRRVVLGEDLEDVAEGLCEIARTALPGRTVGEHALSVELAVHSAALPFHQDADSPFVRGITEATGGRPIVVPYGSNMSRYVGVGKTSVVFGPGSIDHAHRPDEHVRIDQLALAARMYASWWGLR
jgi:acetylornithine deacetylase/succinyl-diaminopimelate desuccinylase-like protein